MRSELSAPNVAPKTIGQQNQHHHAKSHDRTLQETIADWRVRYRRQSVGAVGGNGAPAAVHPFTQFLAGLEVWHMFAGQGDRIAGLRIAAHARWAKMQRKTSKSANLDAIAVGERMRHLFKHALDGQLDIVAGQMLLAG